MTFILLKIIENIAISKQLTEDMADLLLGSLKMYSNYSDIKRRLEDFLSKVTISYIIFIAHTLKNWI